ncbi:MAG TPA: Fe-S cluster assembly protein SufD [Xanthobacteraceae bacterium]|nr:Fe-S cluster assembly protein SufD [Xanthobacteraceae bacterium]
MNAEIRPIRTAAESALSASFAAAKGTLPGAQAVAAMREEAFHRFERQGLPSRRVEDWKYTDLRAAMRDALPLAAPPDAAARACVAQAGALAAGLEARRIVFVDGAFVAELSDLAALEPGLTIGSMAAALAAGDPLIATHLGKVAPSDDVAVALNTAFMGDGAVIRVAARATLARPLHLVFANSGLSPAAIFLRSLIVVEHGARAMVVESHEGATDCADQVNAVLELLVGDEAHVDHVKLTGAGAGALHVWSMMARVGAHARFNAFLFTTGGAVVRNQLLVCFAGEETVAGIRGATLLKGSQHADVTLFTEHAAPACTSRETFKSVLDDSGRSVFQGKIIVRRGAQKTDARMATHALLLTDTAEADNKPELEIYADDVQCGHGATSGALDQDLLFYLNARGIPEKEAETLLIQAFVGEAVEGIEHAGLRDALMDQVAAWLEARK